jgi:hypothetical protein
MRKLTLDIDALEVDTFNLDPESSERGTVDGNAETGPVVCSGTCPTGSFPCSLNDAQTCARRRTDYASCYLDCECTNLGVKCVPLN